MAVRKYVFRKLALGGLLAAWLVPCTAVSVVLLASHTVPLPTPPKDDGALHAGLAELRTTALSPEQSATWTLVHVLYGQCRCSEQTLEYLVKRGPKAHASEVVLLVGDNPEFAASARAAGFALTAVTAHELKARFNIETAPLLLVLDPSGAVRYAGGYTARKQGLDYQDTEILETLQHGGAALELPPFGCAASRELQKLLDPIGIKYATSSLLPDHLPDPTKIQ
jgi:hypothetical protein